MTRRGAGEVTLILGILCCVVGAIAVGAQALPGGEVSTQLTVSLAALGLILVGAGASLKRA